MRFIGQMLLLLLTLIVLASGVYAIWQWQTKGTTDIAGVDTADFKRRVTYELSEDEWVRFPLPNAAGIRVLNTPLIRAEIDATSDLKWNYALEYQLLGRGDKVLRQWVYHYRTGITRYVQPATQNYRQHAFVEDLAAIPADSRELEIKAEDLQESKDLRVRIHHQNSDFLSIAVRVYTLEKQSKHKLGYLWSRLNDEAKEQISEVSVHGEEYLRESEKANLLLWRWRPIGPAGVHDIDFKQRVLYYMKEELAKALDESVLPEGIYTDPQTRGVLPIPEGVWELKLDVESVDEDKAVSEKGSLQIHWRGRELGKSWKTEVAVDKKTTFDRAAVQEGVIEFTSSSAMVVRAYLSRNGESRKLQASEKRLRTYLCDSLTSVDFEIEHISGLSTPVRVDLRRLIDDTSVAASTEVQYQLLDAQDKLIENGVIALSAVASFYDRVVSNDKKQQISDPVRRYFRLQESIAKLRFLSLEPVSVAIYTRPADLPRVVRAPEEYQSNSWSPDQHPAWFYLRAQDHEARIINRQVVSLKLQTRPQDQDADLAAGRYQLIDYEPQGEYFARQILVPRSSTQDVPERSRAAVFSPISANQNVSLNITSYSGRTLVSPTLIYVADTTVAEDVIIYVDGKNVSETRLFSSRAEIRLPAILTGRHTVKLKTRAPGQWWINYGGSSEDAQLIRRAWAITDEPIRFNYQKQTDNDETLTGTIYCKDAGRTQVDVRVVEPVGINENISLNWTFLQRRYDLRIDADNSVPVFDKPDEWLNSGQRFFLPLGANLPVAKYQIQMRASNSNACYLTLNRLLPGQPAIRRFFREQDLTTGTMP